jgi:hypothetical protein
MQLPVEITVWGTTLAQEDEALIRRCAERFPEFFQQVRECRVAVVAPLPRRGEHPEYTARVRLALPGGEEISVAEPAARDRFTVIQGALDRAGRRLEDYAVHHRYAAPGVARRAS